MLLGMITSRSCVGHNSILMDYREVISRLLHVQHGSISENEIEVITMIKGKSLGVVMFHTELHDLAPSSPLPGLHLSLPPRFLGITNQRPSIIDHLVDGSVLESDLGRGERDSDG